MSTVERMITYCEVESIAEMAEKYNVLELLELIVAVEPTELPAVMYKTQLTN
jgi:hypothetical protein